MIDAPDRSMAVRLLNLELSLRSSGRVRALNRDYKAPDLTVKARPGPRRNDSGLSCVGARRFEAYLMLSLYNSRVDCQDMVVNMYC